MPRLVPYRESSELIRGKDPAGDVMHRAEMTGRQRRTEKGIQQLGQELGRTGDRLQGDLEALGRLKPMLTKSMEPSLPKWREPAEMRKRAAADFGRQMAHARVGVELAKVAGQTLAHQVGSDQEFEKTARLMVKTGMLSMEDFLLEKEAAWAGLRSLFSRARSGMSGVRKRVGGWFNRGKQYSPDKAAKGWTSSPNRSLPTELTGAAKPKAKAPAPTPEKKKGFGWGKAALGLGAAGTIYGGAKLIPAAARAIESTSTTPMAHGLGWSPVSYGYGYTPYGPGMATMGGGA